MILPAWLPEPLNYEGDYNGDWDGFLEDSYSAFKDDFIDNQVRYRGKKVNLSNRFPDLGDGKHGSYWHTVSTGNGSGEESKLPDIKRMEAINWVRPMLENCPDADLLEWEEIRSNERRRNDVRTVVWCKKHKFVIILAKLDYVYILVTAYTVDYKSTERKLQQAYNNSLSV